MAVEHSDPEGITPGAQPSPRTPPGPSPEDRAAGAAPLEDALDLEALEPSRRLAWQVAIDAAGVGTFDWDIVTGVLEWDERFAGLFGYDLEEGLRPGTDAIPRRVHPDDRARVWAAIEAAIEACGEYSADFRIVLPGGTTRWVTVSGRVLAGPAGRAVRMLGAAHDTTAARDADGRVARVLESMPAAIFLVDCEWRFVYVNAMAERLLGGPRQELIGTDLWSRAPEAVGGVVGERYRAAMATGTPTSFEAYVPMPIGAWYEVQVWPDAGGLSVSWVDITARRAAQELAERAAGRAELLAQVTVALTETLDADRAVARLVDFVVPTLAEWCIVSLVPDDRPGCEQPAIGYPLRDVGWAHVDPAAAPVLERYLRARVQALTPDNPVARALRTGQLIRLPADATAVLQASLASGEARELIEQLAPDSAVILPLRARGRTVGLISLYNGARRRALQPADVDVARDLAGRAGLALDNTRLYQQQLRLAEELQRAMLTAPPRVGHLQFAVRYVAAGEAAQVGGDWYDAFSQPDGAVTVAIGDVVGHDVVAAAAMGQLRSMLRAIAAYSGKGPADVLHGLDTTMATLRMAFTATAVVARIEQSAADRAHRTARVHWSNAGHPPPLIVRADGTSQVLNTAEPDLLLGLDPSMPRTETALTLYPGTTLLLYTDGLIERRGQALDDGLAQLRRALAVLTRPDIGLDELCDRLLARMLPAHSQDDVALIALRLDPADPPPPPAPPPAE
jgi:PAS domain S-box-containing protein